MKRMLFKSFFALALVLGMEQSVNATIHTVQVGNNFFLPAQINTVTLGDTIKWVWSAGMHTTTSTTIPSGAATWDHVIASANDSFMYVPTVVGTYNYKCTPHAPSQVGSFVVNPVTSIGSVTSAVTFNISPNPARTQVSVKSDAKTMQVSLVDAVGKLVRQLEQVRNTGTERVFSLQGIAAGLYMMQIKADDIMATEKLMVQE